MVDSASNNYHINSTSALVDSGSSIGPPSIDFDGNSRPQNGSYDIGAFEYVIEIDDVENIQIINSEVTLNWTSSNVTLSGLRQIDDGSKLAVHLNQSYINGLIAYFTRGASSPLDSFFAWHNPAGGYFASILIVFLALLLTESPILEIRLEILNAI